jgi:drug/metabolite transporter (DMT)-like permease
VPPLPPRALATAALVLACAAWGISFVFLKDLDTGLERALGEPWWLAACWVVAVRFLLAGALLAPLVARGLARPVWRDALLLAVPSVTGYLLQVAGMRGLDAGTNAFITSLYTPLTPLLAWALLRRAPGARVALAAPVALLGVALLGGGLEWAPGAWLHAACVAAGAVCWALQILGIDRWARRHPPGAFSCALFLWIGLGGLLATGLGALGAGVEPARLARPFADPALVRSLGGLVVVSTIVAMVLINAYQPALDPSRAALLYTLEPAFAAGFAVLLQGERFEGLKLAGCLVLLLANLIVEAPARRRRPTLESPGT